MSIYGTIPLVVNVKARVDEVRKSLQSVSRQVSSFARSTATTAVTAPVFNQDAFQRLAAYRKGWEQLVRVIDEQRQAIGTPGAKILKTAEIDAVVLKVHQLHDAMMQLSKTPFTISDFIPPLIQKFNSFRDVVVSTGGLIKQSLSELYGTGKITIGVLPNLLDPVMDKLRNLSISFYMAGQAANRWVQQNIVSAGQLRGIWYSVIPQITGAIQGFYQTLQSTMPQITMAFTVLGSTARSVASIIGTKLYSAFTTARQAITIFGDVGKTALGGLRRAVMALLTPIRMISSRLTKLRGEAQSAGKGFKVSGMKLAWFGFRLIMVGRILSRYLTNPLKKGLANLQNWQGAITSIGFALGFLSSQGLLSGNMMGEMQDTMMGLPETGMLLKSVLTTMGLAFLKIAQDILPILAPMLIDLAEAMMELWNTAGPEVLDMLNEMSKTSFPEFIRVLRDVGPAILKGVVAGLKKAVPILTKALDVISPFADKIGEMAGLLVGLAPLMTAFGFGLYFASIPLQAFVSLSGFLKGAITSIISSFVGLLTSLPNILMIGAALLGLGFILDQLGIDVGPIINKIIGTFGKLASGIMEKINKIDWERVFYEFKIYASGLWNKFMTWAGSAATAFGTWIGSIDWDIVFDNLKTWAGAIWSKFKEWGGDAQTSLKQWIDNIDWDAVWSSLAEFLTNLGTTVGQTLQTLGSDLANAVTTVDWAEVARNIITSIGTIWGMLAVSVANAFGEIDWGGIGEWIAYKVFTPLSNVWEKLTTDPIAFFHEILAMADRFKSIKDIAAFISEPLKEGFQKGIEAAEDANETIIDNIYKISKKSGLIDQLSAAFVGSAEEARLYSESLQYLTTGELQNMIDKINDASDANHLMQDSISVLSDDVATATGVFESGATQINNYNMDLSDIIANAPGVIEALDNITASVTKLGQEAEITANSMSNIMGDATDAIDNTLNDTVDTTKDLVDVLDDVSDNMDTAADAIDNATDSLDSWSKIQDIIKKDSRDLWMTSLGSDIMRNMEEATRGFEMASSAALGFNDVSTSLTPAGGGAGIGRGSPAPQYINITLNFDGVELSSDVDLDAFTQEISYRLADKLKEEMRR